MGRRLSDLEDKLEIFEDKQSRTFFSLRDRVVQLLTKIQKIELILQEELNTRDQIFEETQEEAQELDSQLESKFKQESEVIFFI